MQNPKTFELRQFFQAMNDLLNVIERQTLRLNEMSSALEAANVAKIVEWAQKRLDKSYSFDGLVIRHTSDGAVAEFRVPNTIGFPDYSFVSDFRDQMNEVRNDGVRS